MSKPIWCLTINAFLVVGSAFNINKCQYRICHLLGNGICPQFIVILIIKSQNILYSFGVFNPIHGYDSSTVPYTSQIGSWYHVFNVCGNHQSSQTNLCPWLQYTQLSLADETLSHQRPSQLYITILSLTMYKTPLLQMCSLYGHKFAI